MLETLTEQERHIFRLRVETGLTGREIAARIGKREKTGSNEARRVVRRVHDGFTALILATEGSADCRMLAAIVAAADMQTQGFTRELSHQVVTHVAACSVCAAQQPELLTRYEPVLIPILFVAELRERVLDTIQSFSAGVPAPSSTTDSRSPPRTPPDREGGAPGTAVLRRPRSGRRVPVAPAVIATAAAVLVIGAGTFLATRGSASRQPPLSPAVAIVQPCANAIRVLPYITPLSGQVELPGLVRLPPDAAVYGTAMQDGGTSQPFYVIGPAGKTCSAYNGASAGAGIDVEPNGAGVGVHEIWRAGGSSATDILFACPYIPGAIPTAPAGVTPNPTVGIYSCHTAALPGQIVTPVATTTPDTYVAVVHVPPGVSKEGVDWTSGPEAAQAASTLPTVAVFAAHVPRNLDRERALAPEISCTLQPAQLAICRAALDYLLAQFAARVSMPVDDLTRTIQAVNQRIT